MLGARDFRFDVSFFFVINVAGVYGYFGDCEGSRRSGFRFDISILFCSFSLIIERIYVYVWGREGRDYTQKHDI